MARTATKINSAPRGRPRKQVSESYHAEIEDWQVSYSLAGAAPHDFVEEAFWEHFAIEILGRFISPVRLRGKSLNVRLMGKRRYDDVMDDPIQYPDKAEWVASLTVRGEVRELLGSFPWSALWGLCPAIQAKAVKVISMHGEALFRGHARIRSLDFCHHIDPGDL